MGSRSKFLAERSKSQNELLKELVLSETKVEDSSHEFQKYLLTVSKRLPNNSYLSVNSNSVQRYEIFNLTCKSFIVMLIQLQFI